MATTPNLPAALAPMIEMPNWVMWKWERGDNNKLTKVPYQVNGAKAASTRPNTWTEFAIAAANCGAFDGIGFCLHNSPFAAFDIDDCITDTGDIAPWATQLIARANSYTEITISGRGLRIIGYGAAAALHKKFAVGDGLSCELYRRASRYIVMTGNQINTQPLVNIDQALDEVYNELEAGKTATKEAKRPGPGRPKGSTNKPRELPQALKLFLSWPNPGAGGAVAEYPSRSEALFAFIRMALLQSVDERDIVYHLLNPAWQGCALYQHCTDNNGEDYVRKQIEKLLNDDDVVGQKRLIRVKPGELHLQVDASCKALIGTNRPVYYHGMVLVEPIWRFDQGVHGSTIISTLSPLTEERLSYMISKHSAVYQKWSGSAKAWIADDPPVKMLKMLLSLQHWEFPTVVGIINSPTLRPSGTVIDTPGYDRETKLWLKSKPETTLPPLPATNRTNAEVALARLTELISGFPFEDNDDAAPTLGADQKSIRRHRGQVSRTVALCGIMTPVLRGAFPHAPLTLFVAPESGTGKTYLMETIARIATGRAPAAVAGAEDVNEMEKRLTAVAFEARPIVSLNNIDFDLKSGLLNQLITEDVVALRVFGYNDRLIECDCRAMTFYANGNNVRVVGDLVRRTLRCQLNALMEAPENRSDFEFDPIELIYDQRNEYLRDIFTIALSFRQACSNRDPAAVSVKAQARRYVGFESWSDFVRLPLMWLGCPDPLISIDESRSIDPEREAFHARIEALAKIYGVNVFDPQRRMPAFSFTAADIVKNAFEQDGRGQLRWPELMNNFSRDGKKLRTDTVGQQLARDNDRRTGDRYVKTVTTHRGHAPHSYAIYGEKEEIPSLSPTVM